MRPQSILVGLAVVALLAAAGECRAQGLGSQGRLGAPGSSTSANEGNLLRGNERFIRGNRRANNFIGTDARDRRGFVGTLRGGTTQAVAPPAVRIRRSASVNTTPATVVNRATGAYQPRLAIGFEVLPADPEAVTADLVRQLQATPGLHPANRIEVSVADATATLRGVVASERDRTLIERLVLFEPGISAVRNDLKVMPELENPGQRPTPSPPPPSKSPGDRPAGSGPAK